jgi:hypothetical protein
LKEFYHTKNSLSDIGKTRISVAMDICRRRLKSLDSLLEEGDSSFQFIRDGEYPIINNPIPKALYSFQRYHHNFVLKIMNYFRKNSKTNGLIKDGKLKPVIEQYRRMQEKYNKVFSAKNTALSELGIKEDFETTGNKSLDKEDRESEKIKIENEEESELNLKQRMEQEEEDLKEEVKRILDQMGAKFPQFYVNGFRNIWVLKPIGLSRGRGIHIVKNLKRILEMAKEKHYVAQKYIENPLLIMNRKVIKIFYIFFTFISSISDNGFW